MTLRLGILFTSILLLAADPAKTPEKKPPEKLEGTWVPTGLIYNGKDMTNAKKMQFRFVFKDNNEATVEGSKDVKKEYARIKMKFDPSFDPHIVDITISAGVQEGAKIEGIYKWKDDELTICAKVLGGERPNEFDAPEGSSIVLLVLKPEKK